VSKEPCRWWRRGMRKGGEEERKPTEFWGRRCRLCPNPVVVPVAAKQHGFLSCVSASLIGHCFSCIQPCPGDACDATLLLSTHPPPCRGATFERLLATSNRCIISGSRSSRAPPSPTFLYCFFFLWGF
jgi:hypothetical protein